VAVKLTKIIPDATLDNWRKSVFVALDIFDGLSPSVIGSFNLNMSQNGGTFTLVLENQFNSHTYVKNQFVTVFRRGSLEYTGTINELIPGRTKGGVALTITGTVNPPAIKYISKCTFMSNQKFTVPDFPTTTALANDKTAFEDDETIKFLGNSNFSPTVAEVMQNIAAFSGVAINVDQVIELPQQLNYKVYRYVLGANNVFDALEELAKACGCNAVTRMISPGVFGVFIVDHQRRVFNHTYEFSDTLDGLEPASTVTDFTGLVIHGSSDITPYNSSYAGVPESVGTISFESGPVALIDFSKGEGVVQKQDQWEFPEEETQNKWSQITIDPTAEHTFTEISRNLPVTQCWDYKLVSENPVTFSSLTNQFLSNFTITGVNPSAPKPDSNVLTRRVFKYLVSWAKAVYTLKQVGDIYPKVLVIPRDAPDMVERFDIPDNEFNTKLFSYSVFAGNTLNANLPSKLSLITPSGYSINVFKNKNLTQMGFTQDGGCYIGLIPRSRQVLGLPVYPQLQMVQTSVTEITGVQFDTVDFTLGSDVVVVTSANYVAVDGFVTLASFLRGKRNPNLTTEYSIVRATSSKTADPNNYTIREILEETLPDGTQNKDKALIKIANKARKTTTGDKFYFAKADSVGLNQESLRELVNPNNNKVLILDSGVVQQNRESLKGEWTLYGFRRKVYTPTLVASLSTPGMYFLYDIDDPNDSLTNAQKIEQVAGFNPREISSSLITDFLAPLEFFTHLSQLALKIKEILNTEYFMFSPTFMDRGQPIPEVGDSLTINNGLAQGQAITSKVIGWNLSVSRQGGSRITINCGRLPIL